MSKNQWNKIYKKDGKKYKYYDIIDIPHPDLEKVMKVFKKAKVKKVLDLGCGAGRNTWPMAKNGFEVYGLDLAKDGINLL
ncbi:MAG: class I SAM-dependent methyltransferase, partial [Patescibacteria group bacterium]